MLTTISIYLAYIIFGGSLHTIQRAAAAGRASPIGNFINVLFALIGTIAGIAILGFYWYKAFWYNPPILLAASILFGSFLFGFLDRKLGATSVYFVSIAACPISAIICFYFIYCLKQI